MTGIRKTILHHHDVQGMSHPSPDLVIDLMKTILQWTILRTEGAVLSKMEGIPLKLKVGESQVLRPWIDREAPTNGVMARHVCILLPLFYHDVLLIFHYSIRCDEK